MADNVMEENSCDDGYYTSTTESISTEEDPNEVWIGDYNMDIDEDSEQMEEYQPKKKRRIEGAMIVLQ